MKQIKNLDDLIGKTISATAFEFSELWIKFDDGSFAVFTPTKDYDDCDEIVLNEVDVRNTEHILLELGILSEEEFIENEKKEKEEYEKRKEELEEQEKKRIEEWQRQTYEKLKLKFEILEKNKIEESQLDSLWEI